MKAFVLCVAFCCALAAGTVSAQGGELVLLEVAELDSEDTAHLRELLDRPSRVVRLPASEADPVAFARSLSSSDVLILDRTHDRVSLVQARAPEVLTRTTGNSVSRSTYAVSFVAAELLTLAAQMQSEREHRFGLARAWLRGSADVLLGAAPYGGVWRPTLGIGGVWSRPVRRLGLAIELMAALNGHASKGSSFGEVRIRRQDLDARCGPAYRHGAFTAVGFGQLGLSIRHAEYTGPGGNSAQYFSATVGAGLQLQASVLPWLSLLAETSGGTFLSRADFAIHGQSTLREGAWFARVGVGLALVLPVR